MRKVPLWKGTSGICSMGSGGRTRQCVGLDPVWDKIPDDLKWNGGQKVPPNLVLLRFNQEIIDYTADVAGTYKPQSAYYEAFGELGYNALRRTVAYMTKKVPATPRILDAKRQDIDRTNQGYVDSIFGRMKFDAVTLQIYLGGVISLAPFLALADKGLIPMCRTSNKDANEWQDKLVALTAEELDGLLNGPAHVTPRECTYNLLDDIVANKYHLVKMYKLVALRVANHWNTQGNCLIVVGATYPKEAAEIRELVGEDLYFLMPGAGTQAGDIRAAVQAARNSRGEGIIVNSSSGIIHASSDSDFAEVARRKTIELNDQINEHRYAAAA